jgi:putative ABC transport system ATP-binding protein
MHLAPGQQVALVGPSGSGKSTLLHLLAGLAVPDEGEVHFGATLVSACSASQRDAWRRGHIGLVFQQFHLFAQLSAMDNVLLAWTFECMRPPGAARGRAAALLRELGVPPLVRCGMLSRGEQQRVAVARALARQPSLVLADEPTASLDPARATAACSLLQALCYESGATLVLATHDPRLASKFEQRLDLASPGPVP